MPPGRPASQVAASTGSYEDTWLPASEGGQQAAFNASRPCRGRCFDGHVPWGSVAAEEGTRLGGRACRPVRRVPTLSHRCSVGSPPGYWHGEWKANAGSRRTQPRSRLPEALPAGADAQPAASAGHQEMRRAEPSPQPRRGCHAAAVRCLAPVEGWSAGPRRVLSRGCRVPSASYALGNPSRAESRGRSWTPTAPACQGPWRRPLTPDPPTSGRCRQTHRRCAGAAPARVSRARCFTGDRRPATRWTQDPCAWSVSRLRK